ncbi:nitrogenase component 1 [Paenibacillus sp. S150]|uniref:nitrogenase component 1 n=1 Tax=Paenibacillus sp. S150 TaxID=2749826 RepID=UPI001C56C4D2|nr:nitrogenase component 1 [Paenibacillus sp. S150]MBW4080700.1 nitrogenase [Paenibacillus sp. S150]
MDYIKHKVPPVREDRLAACGAYGGTCSGLSADSKKGCLYASKRTFSQTQGCQLNLSLSMISSLRDAVMVIHSPIGCGGNLIQNAGINKVFQKLRQESAVGLRWINTNLSEVDVISGGEAKLRQAVLKAEREFRPASILVFNSCVPALIGDDIDGIVDDLQKQISATLVPIHCEGFKTKIQATAYDSVYHGLIRNLVGEDKSTKPAVLRTPEEETQHQAKISKTVNLLNVGSMSRIDEEELVRLLKILDLNVRILPSYSHPDDFTYAHEAALNVSICATHDDYFVEHFKQKYGIPYVLRTIPIGIANTNKWLRDIAAFFGLEEETERLIAAETAELEKALEPYKAQFKGKTAFITGGEVRILTTAELLHNLGMEILGLRGYHFDKYGEHLLDEYLEDVPGSEQTIFNVGAGQVFEQANLLTKIIPDLFVGHIGVNGSAAKQGFPIFPLFGQSDDYLGYKGVYEVAARVSRILKNPAFNRNLRSNTRLPYRESWYEQDPFSYINDSAAAAAHIG